MSLCSRYARYSSRGGCGRAPSSNITGAIASRSIAARTARRSGASSFSVELTKTRRRWSGVRMTLAARLMPQVSCRERPTVQHAGPPERGRAGLSTRRSAGPRPAERLQEETAAHRRSTGVSPSPARERTPSRAGGAKPDRVRRRPASAAPAASSHRNGSAIAAAPPPARSARATDAANPRGSAVIAPATRAVGTPASRARPATTVGALPASDCPSKRPSPVITRSAPMIASASPTACATSAAPPPIRAPHASSPNPAPPAAPAPGAAASGCSASGIRSASRARFASSTSTVAASAPFCGPKIAAAPRSPNSGLVTSPRMTAPPAGRGRSPERSTWSSIARPRLPSGTGAARRVEEPGAEHGERRRAAVARRAAAQPEQQPLDAGVQRGRDRLAEPGAVRVEGFERVEQRDPGGRRELHDAGAVGQQQP